MAKQQWDNEYIGGSLLECAQHLINTTLGPHLADDPSRIGLYEYSNISAHEHCTIDLDRPAEALYEVDHDAFVRIYAPDSRVTFVGSLARIDVVESARNWGDVLRTLTLQGMRSLFYALLELDARLGRAYAQCAQAIERYLQHTVESEPHQSRTAPAPANLPRAEIGETLPDVPEINEPAQPAATNEVQNMPTRSADELSLARLVLRRLYRTLRYGHVDSK
jgi:hypothetical protein